VWASSNQSFNTSYISTRGSASNWSRSRSTTKRKHSGVFLPLEVRIPRSQLGWSRQDLLIGDIAGVVASTQDTIQPSPSSNSTKMVSIADHTFHMLSRHMSNDNDEVDFPLYPDPSNMFSQPFQFNGAQTYNMDASYSYPRTQEGYPASTGLGSSTIMPKLLNMSRLTFEQLPPTTQQLLGPPPAPQPWARHTQSTGTLSQDQSTVLA
jgi:hypothetical protein